MSPLHFPTLDVLALALTSEAVPAAVAAAPVEATFEDRGGVVVYPPKGLLAAHRKKLRAIGVVEVQDDGRPRQSLLSWLQMLPLMRKEGPLELSDKTAVLFDIERSDQLAQVVAEMLRLGNDRQSFRHLENGQTTRTLLRVLGPPYYTLLRALETKPRPVAAVPGSTSDSNQPFHLRAFAEQRPRIWVELGCEHPLAARIEPPPGKWLLITAPRGWEMIDEEAFHDVYQALDFQLPPIASTWSEQSLASRFSVHLSLASASSADPAELWVLTENALEQIEELVRASDNELIARLAFAVTESDGQPLVVLRVRPSKLPPPVLVMRGIACRSYLKLPNLFVPVGQRLHPPLRRDAVAKLLAGDGGQIVWLHPAAGGAFMPRSLPDAAFRPLSQWVDYVLDRDHEPLAAWIAAHQFDFDAFICDDDGPARPKTPKERRERPASPAGPKQNQPTSGSETSAPTADEPILAEVVETAELPQQLAAELPQPGELQQRLSLVERQFVGLDEPLDSPARKSLWREMARLNGALDRALDASLCWSHVVWDEERAARRDLAAWGGHLDCQVGDLPPAQSLKSLLADGAVHRQEVMRLAVQLVAAAGQSPAAAVTEGKSRPPAAGRDALALAAGALEKHENLLPVRLAWLAWAAVARLSDHDVLTLARARDRLLERLFQQGLTAEHDLPGFLRAGSGADNDRHRTLREKLLGLRDLVAEWITEPPSPLARTRAYADLIFAYGLMRLGETAESQRVAAWARQQIGTKDTVHGWSLAAFEYRLAEAAQGDRRSQLSAELLQLLELMDRYDRYKADRLRERCRIIEPFERIEPFRRWHRYYVDEFSRELACLFDLTNREELATRLNQLLTNPPPAALEARGRVRLLTTALELAPRLGQQFAEVWLERVLPAWDAAGEVVDRAALLEKALFVAGHYDLRDAVQAFVERFERSLPEIVQTYLNLQTEHSRDRKEQLDKIELLFNQSLRGLRKLGLRDEISRIFAQIVELVRHQPSPPKAKGGRPLKSDPSRSAKLLLTVAGGWFYFGQQEQALPVVAEVREQLFTTELPALVKASLASSYLTAVGQAPLETALPLVRELFDKRTEGGASNLTGVMDPLATSSHFSLAQLDIVEAAVLTLVSDEFILSQETRRWLEEDELLVRRRIHRDVREMVERAG
jgi:hypothetical protein